ncbi:MAG: hypothetical protein IBJ00_02165 [Alphaproteobacteria bacterium]|nr:hypothetical protein [Alphaproteobacteria bacterium]
MKSGKNLIVQEVAISDGHTACNLFEKLIQYYPNIAYYASDYNPRVFVIEKKETKVTLSHTGKALKITERFCE